MISFKGFHTQKNIILQAVRWYLAYALSYRDIEELLVERGLQVDHSSIHGWVMKFSPLLEAEFHRHKRYSLVLGCGVSLKKGSVAGLEL